MKQNESKSLLFESNYDTFSSKKRKGMLNTKTISIRLDDSIYEELGVMLEAMGLTKQTFYETYTRTALRERSIPFIIKAPLAGADTNESNKLAAFARLEALRKTVSEEINFDAEREEAMNEKYGVID